jgi:hypothetical protein
MAYTDPRRATLAYLSALRHPSQTWADANIRIWLRFVPGESTVPEITNRVTGLRQFRLVGRKDWHEYKMYKVWTVEDVETGECFELPATGNGVTVWVNHPKAA